MFAIYHQLPLASSDSIRGVALLPGAPTEQLLLILGVLTPKNATRYEALSYVLGDPTDTRTVICNGSPMAVTANLALALLHLRQKNTIRLLWIDAICIYSYQTTIKDLRILRFVPQFFEGFNFTHLVVRYSNIFFCICNLCIPALKHTNLKGHNKIHESQEMKSII